MADNLPENNQQKSSPAESPSRKSFSRILLGILLSVILGTVLGAGIFLAVSGIVPTLKADLFRPVTENQQQISELKSDFEATQNAYQDEISLLKEENLQLSTQAAELTRNQQFIQETAAASSAQSEQTRATAVENQRALETQQASLETMQARQDSYNQVVEYLATQQIQSALYPQEFLLLRNLSRLNKVYQQIFHANYGEAEETITVIQAEFADLESDLPGFQRPIVEPIQKQLADAAVALPENPSLALELIEVAWELMSQGFPQPPGPGTTATPTPQTGSSPTPRITATPSPTPQ